MEIRLAWENPNETSVVTIWRDEKAFTRNTLPETPLAVFEAGELEYIDEDVVEDGVYYYLFQTTNDEGFSVWSQLYNVKAANTRGPGTGYLVLGDQTLGVFGNIVMGEWYFDEVFAQMGIGYSFTRKLTGGLKYIIDNKVYIDNLAVYPIDLTNGYFNKTLEEMFAIFETRPLVSINGVQYRVTIPTIMQTKQIKGFAAMGAYPNNWTTEQRERAYYTNLPHIGNSAASLGAQYIIRERGDSGQIQKFTFDTGSVSDATATDGSGLYLLLEVVE